MAALESSQTTRQNEYVKVANALGLYRNVKTGRYYGVKKVNGKHREHSLGTADRKIAERRFKEWADSLTKVDSEVEKTTLDQLVKRFEESNRGLAENTKVTTNAIIKSFKKWMGCKYYDQVRQIRPSQLNNSISINASAAPTKTTVPPFSKTQRARELRKSNTAPDKKNSQAKIRMLPNPPGKLVNSGILDSHPSNTPAPIATANAPIYFIHSGGKPDASRSLLYPAPFSTSQAITERYPLLVSVNIPLRWLNKKGHTAPSGVACALDCFRNYFFKGAALTGIGGVNGTAAGEGAGVAAGCGFSINSSRDFQSES